MKKITSNPNQTSHSSNSYYLKTYIW